MADWDPFNSATNPAMPHVHPDGRVYGGIYPPEYYKYPPEDELTGGTWEEGLQAIEDFDWAGTSQSQPEAGTWEEGLQAIEDFDWEQEPRSDEHAIVDPIIDPIIDQSPQHLRHLVSTPEEHERGPASTPNLVNTNQRVATDTSFRTSSDIFSSMSGDDNAGIGSTTDAMKVDREDGVVLDETVAEVSSKDLSEAPSMPLNETAYSDPEPGSDNEQVEPKPLRIEADSEHGATIEEAVVGMILQDDQVLPPMTKGQDPDSVDMPDVMEVNPKAEAMSREPTTPEPSVALPGAHNSLQDKQDVLDLLLASEERGAGFASMQNSLKSDKVAESKIDEAIPQASSGIPKHVSSEPQAHGKVTGSILDAMEIEVDILALTDEGAAIALLENPPQTSSLAERGNLDTDPADIPEVVDAETGSRPLLEGLAEAATADSSEDVPDMSPASLDDALPASSIPDAVNVDGKNLVSPKDTVYNPTSTDYLELPPSPWPPEPQVASSSNLTGAERENEQTSEETAIITDSSSELSDLPSELSQQEPFDYTSMASALDMGDDKSADVEARGSPQDLAAITPMSTDNEPAIVSTSDSRDVQDDSPNDSDQVDLAQEATNNPTPQAFPDFPQTPRSSHAPTSTPPSASSVLQSASTTSMPKRRHQLKGTSSLVPKNPSSNKINDRDYRPDSSDSDAPVKKRKKTGKSAPANTQKAAPKNRGVSLGNRKKSATKSSKEFTVSSKTVATTENRGRKQQDMDGDHEGDKQNDADMNAANTEDIEDKNSSEEVLPPSPVLPTSNHQPPPPESSRSRKPQPGLRSLAETSSARDIDVGPPKMKSVSKFQDSLLATTANNAPDPVPSLKQTAPAAAKKTPKPAASIFSSASERHPLELPYGKRTTRSDTQTEAKPTDTPANPQLPPATQTANPKPSARSRTRAPAPKTPNDSAPKYGFRPVKSKNKSKDKTATPTPDTTPRTISGADTTVSPPSKRTRAATEAHEKDVNIGKRLRGADKGGRKNT